MQEPVVNPDNSSVNGSNLERDRLPMAALNAAGKIKNTPVGEGRLAKRKRMNAAKLIRAFLMSKRGDAVDKRGETRFIQMTRNMVKIACGKSPQAVAAYNALMDRAVGKARPHDDELEAIGKGGIQVVFVNPVELGEPTVERKQLLKQPVADFIDADWVEED